MRKTTLHLVHLHIGVDSTPRIINPVLTVVWQFPGRIVLCDDRVDNVLRVVGNEASAECRKRIALGREPCAVEEALVGTFADHNADIAGKYLARKIAAIKACEEGWRDKVPICCWSELMNFDGFRCVEESLRGDRT
jgi:hypothetical protein